MSDTEFVKVRLKDGGDGTPGKVGQVPKRSLKRWLDRGYEEVPAEQPEQAEAVAPAAPVAPEGGQVVGEPDAVVPAGGTPPTTDPAAPGGTEAGSSDTTPTDSGSNPGGRASRNR